MRKQAHSSNRLKTDWFPALNFNEKWIVELIKDWDTPKGKNLIRRWRNQVKLKGKRPKPNIVDVFQLMLSSLFNG